MDIESLVPKLTVSLGKAGLDIVAPLQLKWYNEAIPTEVGARIKLRGSAGSKALVVLVGNSKLVWEPFLEACAKDSSLLESEHPFNQYVMSTVDGSLQECAARFAPRIYWSHLRTDDLEGECQYVAMQRMADAVGLAYLDNSSHLCLHPKFGPWFSLRCALVFDDLTWDAAEPHRMPNPMCHTTRHYVKLAMETAINCAERRLQRLSSTACGSAPPTAAALLAEEGVEQDGQKCCYSPFALTESTGSTGSSRGCSEDGAKLDGEAENTEYGFAVHDSQVASPPPKPTMDALASTWKKWLAVRDAPCPGHPWRYCEEQIQYHYTADKEVLLHAVARYRISPSTPDCTDATLACPPLQSSLGSLVIAV